MTRLDLPSHSLTSAGDHLRDSRDPALEPELVGEAEVRGRLVTVTCRGGMLHGDPELMTRLIRVSGRFPDTPLEFLSALRTVGGRCRLEPSAQD
jgi:hypothetical protein